MFPEEPLVLFQELIPEPVKKKKDDTLALQVFGLEKSQRLCLAAMTAGTSDGTHQVYNAAITVVGKMHRWRFFAAGIYT
jgi:hypothetical protein